MPLSFSNWLVGLVVRFGYSRSGHEWTSNRCLSGDRDHYFLAVSTRFCRDSDECSVASSRLFYSILSTSFGTQRASYFQFSSVVGIKLKSKNLSKNFSMLEKFKRLRPRPSSDRQGSVLRTFVFIKSTLTSPRVCSLFSVYICLHGLGSVFLLSRWPRVISEYAKNQSPS